MKLDGKVVIAIALIIILWMMLQPKTSGYGGYGGYGTVCTSDMQCKGTCVYPFHWPWKPRAASGKCTSS